LLLLLPLPAPSVQNTVLNEIAKETDRTVAQVALRWQVQRGVIVIPKSVRLERMVENKDLLGWSLSAEHMAQIDALDTGDRFVDPPWMHGEPSVGQAWSWDGPQTAKL
jgi:diketogulonate reductase-like aldo/keto reductase